MIDNPFLFAFLLINVFLIGVVATIAIQHAIAHFRPHHDAEPVHKAVPETVRLTREVRKQLIEKSQAEFQAVLDKAAAEFSGDLASTRLQLQEHLSKGSSAAIDAEVKQYQAKLQALTQQLDTTLAHAQTTIVSQQTDTSAELTKQRAALEAEAVAKRSEMQKQLTDEMAAEKQRLLDQLDTKLADAVVSFLTETLQHNVDLGAQAGYLTAMLEEHKDELKRGVSGEV
ncbi:MAG: hypothetical protein JWN33_47 [Candidatus Saccharibacteria bacterium]|nr:hypothetical protein [Candidatus Saccharibacteria bacterium]